MNLILLGMPGAGKGTQGAFIARLFSIPHISTGDIFRDNIRNTTPLGTVARGYMDKGELVPDDVVTEMVRERLTRDDCSKGFILDGFPRTVAQARALDEMLREWGRSITAVLEFRLPEEEAVRRLSSRRVCTSCSTVYNLINSRPGVEGICDACGAKLYQRDDDHAEVILNRLKVYEKQTAPLLDFYGARNGLEKIDASASVEEIREKIQELLKKKVES